MSVVGPVEMFGRQRLPFGMLGEGWRGRTMRLP